MAPKKPAKGDAVERSMASLMASMEDWSEDRLIDFVKANMAITVDGLEAAAAGVGVLEKKGSPKLSQIPVFIRHKLLAIAHERLHAGAYLRFHRSGIERSLMRLSLGEQKRLAEGGKVRIYSFPDGVSQYREVRPEELSPFEVRQIFGPNGIRNHAEQRSWLEAERKRKEYAPEPKEPISYVIDTKHEKVTFICGNEKMVKTPEELIEMAKQAGIKAISLLGAAQELMGDK